MSGEFPRFILVGFLKTGGGYALYLLLLALTLPPVWAYSVSYCIGVMVSYFISLRYVFRQTHSLRKMLSFPLVYITQYIVGVSVLKTALSFSVPPAWAGLLIIPVTVPITFLMSRFLLRETR